MCSASLFEFNIKNKCKNFIDNPKSPISTFPELQKLITKGNKKPIVDQMFAKLEAYDNCGIETLNTEKFYTLFGGTTFSQKVEKNFNDYLQQKITTIEKNRWFERLS